MGGPEAGAGRGSGPPLGPSGSLAQLLGGFAAPFAPGCHKLLCEKRHASSLVLEGFRDGDVKAPRYRTVVKVFLLFHPHLVFTTLRLEHGGVNLVQEVGGAMQSIYRIVEEHTD